MSRRGDSARTGPSRFGGACASFHLQHTPETPGGGQIRRHASGVYALSVGDGYTSVVNGATVFCTREQLDEMMADLNTAYANVVADEGVRS